jgi:hypothetical protein
MSVLGFETEWYDTVAGFSKVLFLKFFLDNNTIEILEDKGTFLKRIFYPSVTVNDLYVGNSITVYNRVLVIKKYANAATVRYMGSKEIHFVTTISSEEIQKLGSFIKLSKEYKLVMGKVRTTASSYSNFGVELSPGDVVFETVGVNGADIEAFTEAAQRMLTYGMTMALSPDKIAVSESQY